MDPQERRKKILELLYDHHGKMKLKELSRNFEISQSALYKDLEILEKQRFIRKIYGGLEVIDLARKTHNFYANLQINSRQKKIIAKEAVKLVSDNETISVDGSTTSFYFCDELKKREVKNITIVTNSIFIPQEFIVEENFNVICTGGMISKEVGTCGGDLWETVLNNNFHSNKFFFSSYGISPEIGVLDSFIPGDTGMKKVFAAKSSKNICLADSSKFKISGTISWIGFDNIDILITDSGIDKEVARKLLSQNIELIIVKTK